MKRQVLTMAGLLFTSVAIAQTQKGNGILSGSVSTNYSRQEFNFTAPGTANLWTTWEPTVTLTGGRFWTDNWLAGISASFNSTFGRQRETVTPSLTYISNRVAISITPFVRRYWQFNSVYLFAGAGLSVNVINSKQPSFDNNGQPIGAKSSSLAVSPKIEAGVNYFLTNRLGLQIMASAGSLPLNTSSLSAGLVYWTGSDLHADSQEKHINSQTDPGKLVVEGSFSVTSQKDNSTVTQSGTSYQETLRSYSFNPSIGFFIKKNSLIGISIPISCYSDNVTSAGVSTNDNTTWTVGISPYYQYYWSDTRLTPYTRINAGYARYTAGSFKGNGFSGGMAMGLAYMVGNRFIIETALANASISYSTSGRENAAGNSNNWTTGISAGLTGNFAVRYVLR